MASYRRSLQHLVAVSANLKFSYTICASVNAVKADSPHTIVSDIVDSVEQQILRTQNVMTRLATQRVMSVMEEDLQNPHDPLNLLKKLYVDAVTYSEKSQVLQDQLHEDDRAAQWFTIKSNPSGNSPRIQVTDRFRKLCSPGILPNEYSSKQYPGFVSFVGDTGTGKSTLLRAMVLMGHLESEGDHFANGLRSVEDQVAGLRNALRQPAYGPVSKSGSAEHMTDPTSFGVHLYKDLARPTNSESFGGDRPRDTPILFADCEGFRAGLTLTNAERSDPNSFSPNLIMDSPITAKSYGSDGKNGIDLFYARFLYTISDVIVLIMSSDGEFFTDMQRLAEWAASAIHRSVNHLAKKTLIIVRNKATVDYETFFKADELKENLLDSLSRSDATPLWKGSPLLQSFRDDFNSKQNKDERQIHDNFDLLKRFFADIRACNIPDSRTTPLDTTFRQYRDLRSQIVDASGRSQSLRAKNWMQYNVPILSHILNRAFEHFRTSDEPFDFFKAARNDNFNPASTSDHISNFITHLQVRDPDEIFEKDLMEHCRAGFESYRVRYQKCGFYIQKGGVCIKQRGTHEYEHCDEKGARAQGPFDEKYALDIDTMSQVRKLFQKYYRQLCTGHDKVNALPPRETVRDFREAQLQRYMQFWIELQSNKSCFGCLLHPPDHMLECGHAFCQHCVRELGFPSDYFEHGWVLNSCILCQTSWQDGRNLFRLHPACAGVRVLTLDGGGIRGIVEISLLEKLQEKIDLDVPLREFFDLIMGTSTGGIIALGLATLPESRAKKVSDLKQTFLQLASKAFERKRGQLTKFDFLRWTSSMLMLFRIRESVYPTTPLRKGLEETLFGQRNLFSSSYRSVRVAVTSAKDNGADKCLITNYNRATLSDQDLDFEREDDSSNEMKVWEAALATASAPFYFRRFEKVETRKNYVDGALHSNFPLQYALDEIARIWKVPKNSGDISQTRPPLDFLLSVGTGQQTREISLPVPLRIGGFEAICTTFFNNLDSHRQWLEFERVHLNGSRLRTKVHRLNARIQEPYVALDDYQSMGRIDRGIQEDFRAGIFKNQMDVLAGKLLASLFFFEPSAAYQNQTSTGAGLGDRIPGTIRCRLARGSLSLKHLIDKINHFWYKEIRTDAEFAEESGWKQVVFQDHLRSSARTQGQWLRINCPILPAEPVGSQQVIAVTFEGVASGRFSISGFPIEWHSLKARSQAK
ncbi:hypothetical protein VTL71DRAFT_3615 [Oculimacula yallundae]|uniref:PNPLA domain-containing protein n=1 Tax=Oculimacula yallundae TaxID=86028 RepID=A0ABR4C7Q2_9HELO